MSGVPRVVSAKRVSGPTARRIAIWLLIMTAASCVGYIGGRKATLLRVAYAQAQVTPFTVEIEGHDFEQSGSGQLDARQVVAMRADGATVEESNPFPGAGLEGGEDIRTARFPDGTGFVAYDGIGEFTQLAPLSVSGLAVWKSRMMNPPADCLLAPGETLVGHDSVAGHPVLAISVNWLRNNEQATDWRAADLGCQALKEQTEVRQPDGSLKLVYEKEAVSLSLAAPDPRLFELPSTYKAAAPSQALEEEDRRLGIAWTADVEKSAKRMDFILAGQPVPQSLY